MGKTQKRKATSVRRKKHRTESKSDALFRASFSPMPVLVTAREHRGRATVRVFERNGSVSIDGSALTFPDVTSANMVLGLS
jgi:hypothetical protein